MGPLVHDAPTSTAAPLAPPDAPTAPDLDDELLDLLAADEAWVEEVFDAIVHDLVHSCTMPPRRGSRKQGAWPERFGGVGRPPRSRASRARVGAPCARPEAQGRGPPR